MTAVIAPIAVIIISAIIYFVLRSKFILKKEKPTKKQVRMYVIFIGLASMFCLYLIYWTYGQELWIAFMSSIILTVNMGIAEFVVCRKYKQLGE